MFGEPRAMQNAITFVCAPAMKLPLLCRPCRSRQVGWGEGWSSPGPLSYLFSTHSLSKTGTNTEDAPSRHAETWAPWKGQPHS